MQFLPPRSILSRGAAYCSAERALGSPLSHPSHAPSVHGTFLAAGAPLGRFHSRILNSARAFIPISDLSVTVKTRDISVDCSSWGQDSENGDCPRKPGTSGHPTLVDGVNDGGG